jgi:osmotically-inducible protein OsmY
MKSGLKRWALAAGASVLALTQLTGCFPLAAGGMVMTGMVMTDRRTSGTQVEDEGIELRSVSRINEALGDKVHFNVTSYNRRVLLTGEASTPQARDQLEQIVSKVENVRAVFNETVVGFSSSLSDRSSDTLISGKVKASLVDARDLVSSAFKVVTERKVVYLMGRVTQRESDRASEIARGVSGVVKVVRLFEIITEDELKSQYPAPAASSPAGSNASKTGS